MTNTYEEISIAEIREKVRRFYSITDTKKDTVIDMFIMEAVDGLDSQMRLEQCTATIDVCNNLGDLPCNFKSLVAIVSDACNDNSEPFVYDNFTFCGNDRTFTSRGKRFKFKHGMLTFPVDFEGDSVDVYYNGYRVDKDGFPLLMKSHELYFFRYACYWFGLHLGDVRYREFGRYSRAKRAIIHNENIDQARLDMPAIAAIITGARRYIGTFHYQSPYTVT